MCETASWIGRFVFFGKPGTPSREPEELRRERRSNSDWSRRRRTSVTLREPYVFRFFYAFQEVKANRRQYLETLEAQMFEALGLDKIVLSGDTRYSEALIQNAGGVDVLEHEVVFGATTTEQQQISSSHTLPEQAARVFAAAQPKLAIYSHLILFGATDDDVMAATRKVYGGRVEMGTDLTVIEVGDHINVQHRK